MTITTEKKPLPVVYVDRQVLTCDGCGIEADNPYRVGPDIVGANGWFSGGVKQLRNTGGHADQVHVDFCPDCFPTVQEAQQQASKAIVAAKVAVAAEARGVPG